MSLPSECSTAKKSAFSDCATTWFAAASFSSDKACAGEAEDSAVTTIIKASKPVAIHAKVLPLAFMNNALSMRVTPSFQSAA